MTKFKSFKSNFIRNIASKNTNAADNFIYLQQHTSGRAKRLVDSCAHFESERAYYSAMELLQSEYANEYKVSDEYIRKIEQWPAVKAEDVRALEDLYLFLLDCINYMDSMTIHNPLQSPNEIMKVVYKLPYKMRESWRRRCADITNRYHNVYFKDLIEFIKHELSIIKQPVFGSLQQSSPAVSVSNKNNFDKNKNHRVLTSKSDHPVANTPLINEFKCEYCAASHNLKECSSFSTLKMDEKSKVIKSKGLCFGCLQKGHRSKFCKDRLTCDICTKKHPTFFHEFYVQNSDAAHNNNGMSEKTIQSVSLPSTSTATLTAQTPAFPTMEGKIIFPHVAVKARNITDGEFVTTNCALDNCSSGCWMRESLMKKLGIKTQDYIRNVTTMTNKNSPTKIHVIHNLKIYDFEGKNAVILPVVYTRPDDQWPFDRPDRMFNDDCRNVPALREVPFNFIDQDIELLVGNNIPEMVKPFSVLIYTRNQIQIIYLYTRKYLYRLYLRIL